MTEVRASGSYVLTLHGKPFVVEDGKRYPVDAEIVREFPWAFDAPVESATAKPGERRSVRIPKKK